MAIIAPKPNCYLAALVGLIILLQGSTSVAISGNGALAVGVSVVDSCIFPQLNSLAFGLYDPAATTALNVAGLLTIQCTSGVNVDSIGLDTGKHASGSQRRMLGPTSADNLSYNIFQPGDVSFGPHPTPGVCRTSGAVPWTNSGSGLVTPTPKKIDKDNTTVSVTVCGQIPAQQTVGPDNSYGDQVQIIVNYS